MKLLAISFLLWTSASAFSVEGDLEAHKKMQIDEMSARIAELEKGKACVAAATTKEALQACRKQMKSEREDRKEANIDDRIKKLQDKKANMTK